MSRPSVPIRVSAVAWCCLVALAFAALPASGQVRRCVTPQGQDVYTDRSCGSLGATEATRPAREPVTRVYHGGCAATLQDLVYELTSAIDGGDVNRLAAHYHWPGLSGTEANATLDRLDAITARPLLDLRVATRDQVVEPAAGPPVDPLAAPDVRVVPTGIRLEQSTAPGGAPVTTVLTLHKGHGCWWVRL